jgi:histidine ammonia-lyase
VLAMEALTSARALDLLAPLKTSPALERVRSAIRSASPPIESDRPFYRDIAALELAIETRQLTSNTPPPE